MFLRIEKKFVDLPNGERLAYIEKGSGDKVIVLIHGNFSSCYHYEPLYKAMGDEYKIYAMDLRGYGDSSYNNKVETLHDFADDVALFMDAMKIESAYIGGWSLGGCVAQSLSARYPEKVKKLMLFSSGSVKGYPVFKKDANGMNIVGSLYETKEELALDPVTVLPMVQTQLSKNYKFMEAIWNMTIYTSTSQKRPDEDSSAIFLEETCKQVNLVDADWALMRFNISSETSFYSHGEDIAKNIVCPVLALNGRQDITTPEIMTAENRKFIPQIEQVYYDDCAHSIFVDQIDLVVKDIINFINK